MCIRDRRKGLPGIAKNLGNLVTQAYLNNPKEVVDIGIFRIYLDTKDSRTSPTIGVFGCYDVSTTNLFQKILKRGNTVIDVGANLGWFTLLSAGIVGPEGHVISVEPEPLNFSRLSRSVELNRFENVTTIQKALSDREGNATLHLSEGSTGDHSIKWDSLGGRLGRSIEVRTATLDSISRAYNIRHVDLLKIDVEGLEPEVLLGAKELLEESLIDTIILEWNLREWVPKWSFLLELTKNFAFSRIGVFATVPYLRSVSPTQLRTTSWCNLYFEKEHD